MFQRFRDLRTGAHPASRKTVTHVHPQADDELPFDLELTRRVNGERMAPKWGTRDPSEAPIMETDYDLPHDFGQDIALEDARALDGNALDLILSGREVILGPDMWSLLPRARFGHGGTPLDMQLRLVGHDRTMLRAFDDLRTQLLRSMQSAGWSRIAITAPTAGSGASFTALNLALSIARIPDARTLLMDLDQRSPGIAGMLGMMAPGSIQRLMKRDIEPEDYLVKPAETLTLGLGRGSSHNSSEILHARRTGEVMDDILDALRPDIAIYDLPPMLEHDDLEAFLPQVDGVLLVADATRTLASQITECERRLDGRTHLLGIILNRARPGRAESLRAA